MRAGIAGNESIEFQVQGLAVHEHLDLLHSTLMVTHCNENYFREHQLRTRHEHRVLYGEESVTFTSTYCMHGMFVLWWLHYSS